MKSTWLAKVIKKKLLYAIEWDPKIKYYQLRTQWWRQKIRILGRGHEKILRCTFMTNQQNVMLLNSNILCGMHRSNLYCITGEEIERNEKINEGGYKYLIKIQPKY
ncbi:hypothetical protein Ahy_A10g048476 isoform A [Arachis hypogaea]|uniref:Uncharacterized protein n=1 Tax=Arachis hypogaea TaxID=3818 RepID=A0A445B578_ARAHY|nr:hypothetical protein Ahy_A10g048476 isoform A [Arachis hypogaea]